MVLHVADTMYIRVSDSPYEPFDIRDSSKLIVKSRTKFFELPSIKVHYNEDPRTTKRLFQDYLAENGRNHETLFNTVNDQIRAVYQSNGNWILDALDQYPAKAKRSPFHLARIDFLIGPNMEVYFIEANGSPYLNFEEQEYEVKGRTY